MRDLSSGVPTTKVHKALLAVDVTEEVLDEAEAEGCDIVLTHHPIIFHALKRFNSADPVQRCVEWAIRSRIALYACHTNLDSAPEGMSWRLARNTGRRKPRGAATLGSRRGRGIRRSGRTAQKPLTPWSLCSLSGGNSA